MDNTAANKRLTSQHKEMNGSRDCRGGCDVCIAYAFSRRQKSLRRGHEWNVEGEKAQSVFENGWLELRSVVEGARRRGTKYISPWVVVRGGGAITGSMESKLILVGRPSCVSPRSFHFLSAPRAPFLSNDVTIHFL